MKKTISQFKKAVQAKVTWNAEIGFWFGFVYKQYEQDQLTYEAAIEALVKMDGYTGV